MRLKTQILVFVMLATLVCCGVTSADIFVADGLNANTMYRYSPTGDLIWSRWARGTVNMVRSLENPVLFTCEANVDYIMHNYDTMNGSREYAIAFGGGWPPTEPILDADWGPDYNGDGKRNLYVSVEVDEINYFHVLDVNESTLRSINPEIISTWQLADANTEPNLPNTGIGGQFCFGPDQSGDGIPDLYASRGTNADDNWINVWDAMAPNDAPDCVARIDMRDTNSVDGTRGIGDMIVSPDNPDQLWVVDEYRNGIQLVDTSTLENLGDLDLGVGLDNPTDIAKAQDDKVYIVCRFASSLSPNYTEGTEDPYSNLIEYDPSTSTASLVVESEEGVRYTSVETTPDEAPVYNTTEFTGDVFAADGSDRQDLRRYTNDGYRAWQMPGRSINNLVMGPNKNLLFASKGGIDEMLSNYDVTTGENYDNRFMGGVGQNDAVWGPDYNGDGLDDLYVSGSDQFWVVDVNASDIDNVQYTTLAHWQLADANTTTGLAQTGTGGYITFGPDLNSDGVGEMFAGKGGDDGDPNCWVNIWNPMAPNEAPERIDSIDVGSGEIADGARGIEGIMISPFSNNRVWVLSRARGFVCIVDIEKRLHISNTIGGMNQGRDMLMGPDGKVWFATDGGEIYNYNPVTAAETTFTSAQTGGFDAIEFIDTNMEPSCFNKIDEDFNGDCYVDSADLGIMADNWLTCTDPNTNNCP